MTGQPNIGSSPHSTCERCGRRGTRGFIIIAGKGLRYGGDEQLHCANSTACDKRVAAALTASGPPDR